MPKHKRLIIILFVITFFLSLTVSIFHRNYVVPIIMYHSINTKSNPQMKRLVVTPQTFERQMRFLKEKRYNVLPLEVLADLIRNKKKIPARSLAITFDDGYKDNYTYAFPVLKKYNLPATIFIIVNEVDSNRADRLNWKEIEAMQNSGLITIGSHSLDHLVLTEIKSEKELKRQIFASKRIIEQKLGKSVRAFSYPSARFNELIRQLVIEAGYKVAVVTNPGKKFPNDDLFALKRLRISSTANKLFIFWIETSGYYNFIREHRHK